ncbi:FAD-binding molybdopterin dehydrogenase [Frondihabitans sp. PAMC 28766]|uniref:FAD binding domain-containing protein n=1 Tax=Frondihabitans sp. PAMC 28766 TaxID=1795630 RepID=UPI00078CA642|nr:FAD binding domain-containing protein [Frondihabitans sp. PAMC 28766]AMM19307.1 FAD-binding molybdopterin dehydrogenase [Frondihabitans sp. PAMC 28766]
MDLIEVQQTRVPRTRAEISFGPGERPLGGGTWLFSEAQPGLTGLVDLTALGWEPVTRTDTHLVIAATCTLAELTRILPDADWAAHPLFGLCANSLLMSFKIWNIATVGGNIATALPAGAMTSLMSALDATALIWGPDDRERRMPVAEFVTGVRQTALGEGEILRAIEIPLASLRSRFAFRRIALSNLGRSGSLVIGRADAASAVVFTVTAATPAPVQLRFDGLPTAAALEHAVAGIDVFPGWYDDPHGAPDWREAVSKQFALEILAELSVSGDATEVTA